VRAAAVVLALLLGAGVLVALALSAELALSLLVVLGCGLVLWRMLRATGG
jgi:hypothetical protein